MERPILLEDTDCLVRIFAQTEHEFTKATYIKRINRLKSGLVNTQMLEADIDGLESFPLLTRWVAEMKGCTKNMKKARGLATLLAAVGPYETTWRGDVTSVHGATHEMVCQLQEGEVVDVGLTPKKHVSTQIARKGFVIKKKGIHKLDDASCLEFCISDVTGKELATDLKALGAFWQECLLWWYESGAPLPNTQALIEVDVSLVDVLREYIWHTIMPCIDLSTIDGWSAANRSFDDWAESGFEWINSQHPIHNSRFFATLGFFRPGRYEVVSLEEKVKPTLTLELIEGNRQLGVSNIDLVHVHGNHKEVQSCLDAYQWKPNFIPPFKLPVLPKSVGNKIQVEWEPVIDILRETSRPAFNLSQSHNKEVLEVERERLRRAHATDAPRTIHRKTL